MWWFLVLLGVLIALAGLAVIGLGVSIFISSIGNTLITTGAVAASGGFVITAMGLVLRQLERLSDRIEAGLSGLEVNVRTAAPEPAAPSASAPRPRSGAAPRLTAEDLLEPGSEEETQDEAEPASIPTRPRTGQPPRPARAEERPAAEERAVDPMVEARRQRLERRPEPEPRGETRGEPRAEPRADVRPGPRPRPEVPGPKGTPAARQPPALPPAAGARRFEGAEEPRILKSGIVGGMAYTLYSDGSIQAELPDGVVRFASLQELRDHVAQAQQNR